jgi:hypothetical protein
MQISPMEHGMNIKYIVELNESEREFLLSLVSQGVAHSRKLKRANILLMVDKRIYPDIDILNANEFSVFTRQ